MLRRSLAAMVLVAAFGAVAVTPASASSSSAISDCNSHGRLTQHYSVTALRNALETMPADVQEYTNCYNVIQSQLLAQVPGHHIAGLKRSDASGGSSFLSTPLLVALIVLLVGGGALAGVAIQRRGEPPSES